MDHYEGPIAKNVLLVSQFHRKLEAIGLPIGRASVYRKIKSGLIQSFLWGGRIYVPVEELERVKQLLLNGISK